MTLTKEEIRRLIKLSSTASDDRSVMDGEDPMSATIDYAQLSKNLGLHRPSLNLMTANTGAVRQEHLTRRLMQQLGGGRKSPLRVND